MSTDDFGAYLRRRREAAGLTQEELAQRSGVALRTISDIERRVTRYPQRETLKDLAEALGLEGNERRQFMRLVPRRPGRRKSRLNPRAGIPSPPSPLVGREYDLAAAIELLSRPDIRLLSLIGPVGVGKTRLALAIAHAVQGSFQDGVYFVDLSAVERTADLPVVIAQRLGVQLHGRQRLIEVIASHLRDKCVLLVLDNLEQLDAGPPIARLLQQTTALKIVATSRRALRIRQEQEFTVNPLELPNLDQLPPVEELARVSAIKLFVQRVNAHQPRFRLTASNAQDIATICHRLDGLPLAIELAASRAKIFSPRQMVDRLTPLLDFLGDGDTDLPDRQRSLRVAVAWSVDLLPKKAQTLFARLGVFAGGASLGAIEAICATEPNAPSSGLAPLSLSELWDALEALVDASLVRREYMPNDEIRFTMLQTIRAYALEKLEESGEAEHLRYRLARWLTELAEEAERALFSSEDDSWLERFDMEQTNVRSVLAWAETRRESELALRLAGALSDYWYFRGRIAEAADRLRQALGISPTGSPARAKALVGAALVTMLQGNIDEAEATANEALELASRLGDRLNASCATELLGSIAQRRGRHSHGYRLHREALETFREMGSPSWEMTSLCNLAWCSLALGDFPAASAHLEELKQRAESIGDQHYKLVAKLIAGDYSAACRTFPMAVACHREVFDASLEHGDRWLAADALIGFAGVSVGLRDWTRAAQFFGAAERMYSELDVPFPPRLRPFFNEWVQATSAGLGEPRFDQEWLNGRHLSDADVIAILDELNVTVSQAAELSRKRD